MSFMLALLSKSITMTLPLALLILDFYPLRRLTLTPASWLGQAGRRVLLEKIPFILVGLAGAGISYWAVARHSFFTSSIEYPLSSRVLMALYSMCFYIAKRGKPPKAGNSGKPRSLRSSAPSPSTIPWPSSSSLSGTVDESNAPDHSSSIVQELDEEGVTDDCGQLTARDSCSKLTEEFRHQHGSIESA